MNIVWSEQARNSLAKIYDYIYQDSPRSAEKVLETLLLKSESLKDPRVEHSIDSILNDPKYYTYSNGTSKLYMRELMMK